MTSIKYAGAPWELGLAETHQTLRGQRPARQGPPADRRRPQDRPRRGQGGDPRAPRASVSAPRPMIALGCKYLRICHLNNCATGVATQDEILRKDHYQGTVDNGGELFPLRRRGDPRMAGRAGRSAAWNELIGRTDLLEPVAGDHRRGRSSSTCAPILRHRPVAGDKPRLCYRQPQPPVRSGARWPSSMVERFCPPSRRMPAAACLHHPQLRPFDRRAALR